MTETEIQRDKDRDRETDRDRHRDTCNNNENNNKDTRIPRGNTMGCVSGKAKPPHCGQPLLHPFTHVIKSKEQHRGNGGVCQRLFQLRVLVQSINQSSKIKIRIHHRLNPISRHRLFHNKNLTATAAAGTAGTCCGRSCGTTSAGTRRGTCCCTCCNKTAAGCCSRRK